MLRSLFFSILRRIASALITMILAVFLIFSFLRILPGDPIELMLGEQALPSVREEMRRALGLDQPFLEGLISYMVGILRGDLGMSLSRREPVSTLIARHLPPTALLGGLSFLLAFIGGLALGALGGLHPRSLRDRLSRSCASLALCLPSFLIGPILMLGFAVWIPLFPLGGLSDPLSWVLPSVTLSLTLIGAISRLFRNTLCDLWGQPFLLSARARGAGGGYLFFRHMFLLASYPLLSVLGIQLGALLTGAVITETLFQWPGLGRLLVEGILARDYPLVQGLVLFFVTVYIVMNTVVDLFSFLLDPRIRRFSP